MIKVLGIRFKISRIQALKVVAAKLTDLVHNFILPAHVMGGIPVSIQLRAQILPVLWHAGGLGGSCTVALTTKRGLVLAAGTIECCHA